MPGPHFGHTSDGQPVHRRTADHLPGRTLAQRFNRRAAIAVTAVVGTMWCAYAFTCLALLSLPSALGSGSVIIIVAWVAQTFLQLVLLSVIIVGQNVSTEASDARAAKTLEDTEQAKAQLIQVLDLLDTRTEGGLAEVLAAVRARSLA